MKFVLSCEHAFPDIPEKYQYVFEKDPYVLETHVAYDPGAFDLYQKLENSVDFSKYQTIGRLLVETNRSQHHKSFLSRYSKNLQKEQITNIVQTYYLPYREEIEDKISDLIREGNTVLHISVHTFTPVLNSVKRNCDIGLLYDPKRLVEKEFCRKWKNNLLKENSDLKIRYNYPYLGKADGFTTSLRKVFRNDYLGIELEVNQKWVSENKMNNNLKSSILKSLKN
ncbi:N-formylglutamate amidohydrolase [Christiangramia forsetii]|uniref:N-formylglutamate amidohydrolase n=2 Tax=Christiangramia forsetii TaxID=411153 RepID=A0M1M0_CHRFK|nr:N-formylglutamate amidohydrolase [Christiangramia forsetii]GGG42194.1 hypothetical protein GCM10011532_27500 [Christiangramia forsetii]CAL66515.1 N-formylglutamate amidohydrolase [Christiangramia forsetii KT0803]